MNDLERGALRLLLDPVEVLLNAGMEPDGWQSAFLRSTSRRRLLLCSRQSGKTQATAALCAWTALSQPGKLVLVLSPSLRQSALFLERAKSLVKSSLPFTTHRIAGETKLSLTLSNTSQILSLPSSEERVRGFSPDLLAVDEAAVVADRVWFAASPMMAATQGSIVALSTARKSSGWFFHLWTVGGSEWERFTVTADQCPRIRPEFLEQERRVLGQKNFDREYFCRFDADSTDGFRLIAESDVDAMFV